MKLGLSTIVLACSALMATTAMADHVHQNRYQNDRHAHYSKQDYQWHTGHSFPSKYHSSRYNVHPRDLRQLPRAGARQQWYKVDGRYVLVNTRNHKVVRVIR